MLTGTETIDVPPVVASVRNASVKVELFRGKGVDKALEGTWKKWLVNHSELQGGCFHPEFRRAVAAVRADVELACIESGGNLVALWPFQRVAKKVAHPVGGLLNDFQAIIADPQRRESIDFNSVLHQCRLAYAPFHAMRFQPFVRGMHRFATIESPHIELGESVESYLRWLRRNSVALKRQPQKRRRMERELGPLRLEFDVRDPAILERLIEWKRSRFRRTRTFDILSVGWTQNLLREVFTVNQPGFRGLLSGLWAGDHLVAAHFGMLADHVLHYWFPAHAGEFAYCSPGTQLLEEMTAACCARGITRIDLGYGDSPLKDRFANGGVTVNAGCFSTTRAAAIGGHFRYRVRQAIKRTPFKETAKLLVRRVAPDFGKGIVR